MVAKTFDFKTCTDSESWGQFHQHVYEQVLLAQIPKAPKRQSSQAAFCIFGIWACKNFNLKIDVPTYAEYIVWLMHLPYFLHGIF